LYAIINKQINSLVIVMIGFIGFMISETAVATAEEKQMNESFNQSNFTDRKNIVVTWLETNKTMPENVKVFSISDEDFWMVFEPLLEQSINRSTVSSE
jgi:tRNA(Ile2) C34 agmatinyltransferase TiaS